MGLCMIRYNKPNILIMTPPLIPSDKSDDAQHKESALPIILALLAICLSLLAFGSNSSPTVKFYALIVLVVLFTGQFIWIGCRHFSNKRFLRRKKNV